MSFQKDKLSITELDLTKRGKQLFPTLLKDYLSGESSLDEYYQYAPNLKSFSEAIGNKSKEQINRSVLAEVIKKQYSGIEDAPANISLLVDENTFTITTGHQLCLFTGPLYVCYKILTVINIAERLKEEFPDKNFVPLFWMASEDHDFEEVNHFHLFGQKVTWEAKAGDAVGRMNTEGIKEVLSSLKDKLSSDIKALSILQVFEKAYTGEQNLADATRVLMHQLFGKYGLVTLDADDASLKHQFKEVMKADIEKQASMHAMTETYNALSESYKLPVKSRDINLFYLHDNQRRRLEQDSDGNIKVLDTDMSFTVEECLKRIEEEPERFSPNVVLRPLYEEMILPNLAYIGGPSEIAYWLELKGVFDHHGVNFPVLIPRNSLLVLRANEVKKMSQLNLSLSDLFSEPAELVNGIVTSTSEDDLSVNMEKEEISAVYEKLMARVKDIDPSLENAVKADQSRALGALDNLEKKLLKAAKNKNETVVNQVNKLLESVFPNGSFQERYDSLFSLLIRYDTAIIDQMKDSIEPFDSSLKILSETKD